MTDQPQIPDKYREAILAFRRLARTPFETPPELLRFRQRVSNERARAHRRILERIAVEANIDIQPILEDAHRRNSAKHRLTTQLLKKLQVRAVEAAKTERDYFHKVRSDYLNSFGSKPPLAFGAAELKFHQPFWWNGIAHVGQCNDVLGSWCGTPNFGSHEATADLAPAGNPPGIYMNLFPFISSDNGDCEDTIPGQTFHELNYLMDPPTSSFAVDSVRVDLLGFGVANSVLGDFSGLFEEADPLYEHTFVQLDVFIGQWVNGAWQQWPVASDKLFSGKGDYSQQIRLLLSGQTYPGGFAIRKADIGGGQLLCHLQLACQSDALGSDGRVLVDFRDFGIFVGGVALIGSYV